MKKLKKFSLNQAGNTIVLALAALAVVGGAGVTMMSQSETAKQSVKSVESKKKESFFELQIKSYLADSDVCLHTLLNSKDPETGAPVAIQSTGQITGEFEIDAIRTPASGAEILKTNGVYGSGNITILSMKLAPPMEVDGRIADGDFVVEYQRNNGDLGAKTLSKRFPLRVHVDVTGSDPIMDSYCFLDESDGTTDLTTELNKAMLKVCDGAGYLETNASATNPVSIQELYCRFTKQHYTDQLAETSTFECAGDGEALIIEGFDADPNQLKLKYRCQPIFPDTTCPFGLKYDATSGTFSCFPIEEIVNSGASQAISGSRCEVSGSDGGSKLSANCGGL